MSALVWDLENEKMFEAGVDHGVLYVKKDIVEDGAITEYENGVAWNGLINVSKKAEGYESTAMFAGDIVYDILKSPETLSGSIEAYTYPEEFTKCAGNGLENEFSLFGFVYRTFGKNGYTIHVIYNAYAMPSEADYDPISDNLNAVAFNWEFGVIPIEMDGYLPFNEIIINSWEIEDSKLIMIENALFGNDILDPVLVKPEQIIAAAL